MNIDDLESGRVLDSLAAKLMNESHMEPRPYSTDLNLAWEIARRLADGGVDVELSIRRDHGDGGRPTFLACCTRAADLCITMSCDEESPAAAICRASLKMAREPAPAGQALPQIGFDIEVGLG